MSRRIMLKILSLLMVCFVHITYALCQEVEVSSKAVICIGNNDGIIKVSITNITTDVTIRLTQATNNKLLQEIRVKTDTTIIFNGLGAKEYRIIAFIPGSPIEKTIRIEEPEPLKANTIKVIQVPTNTENCDGIIMAMPTGGTPPYKYLWSENTGNAETAKVEGLCTGIYRCAITDSYNCTTVSASSALFDYDSRTKNE